MLHRRYLRECQKGGAGVGKTKRGKGSKLMAMADRAGLPVAVTSASPHEVALVESTLEARFIDALPERLIGDKAYDSDPLDERLAEQGIEMIAPHKANRRNPKPRMVDHRTATIVAGMSSDCSPGCRISVD